MGSDPKELAEKVSALSGDAMGQGADQAALTDPACCLPSGLQAVSGEMEEPGLVEVTRQTQPCRKPDFVRLAAHGTAFLFKA